MNELESIFEASLDEIEDGITDGFLSIVNICMLVVILVCAFLWCKLDKAEKMSWKEKNRGLERIYCYKDLNIQLINLIS